MKLIDRLRLCWRILRTDPGNLYAHAKAELPPDEGDEMNAMMNRGLLEMVLVFGSQGHSGFSASFATSTLEKLLRYQPLRPLTGEPGEWNEVGNGVFQNNRCSHVFKQLDRFHGQAYDLQGKVFREPSGVCFTNASSLVPIVFPYTPRTEYVDVPGEEKAA